MGRERIELLSKREIEKMRKVGHMAAELLDLLGEMVKPGVSTQALNDFAEAWTTERGAISAPLGYPGGRNSFPRSICTSINEVVCHGIPGHDQVLQAGDIINIDVTPKLDGYHGDTSRTFYVGEVSDPTRRLVEVTRECLRIGIDQVKPGGRVGDIGAAIQEYAEGQGFSVVRDFVGHGIGQTFHTAPQVPHYYEVEVLDDGWTAVTADRKLSAQFEHTMVVTATGVELLTLRDGESWR
jgi:methionyl aminopeptidase